MGEAGKAERRVAQPAGPKAAPTVDCKSWLPVAGLVVGVWATLPHFVTPAINTAERVEIADHVVPGAVIVAISIVAFVLSRNGGAPGMLMFGAGLVICLAGLWMIATHVPLVGQLLRGDPGVTLAATSWHCLAAALVAALGITWVVSYWSAVEG